MKCTAYTKDHRRCGAVVKKPGLDVCPAHVNYYRNWFEKHPPIYGFGRSYEMIRYRTVNEYVDVLKSGRVIPTRSYVYELADDPMHYCYYILLCSCSDSVNPLWNKTLFRNVIACYFHRAVAAKRNLREFIDVCTIMAKDAAAIYFMYDVLVEEAIVAVLDSDEPMTHIIEGIWERLFNQEFWRLVYFNTRMGDILDMRAGFLEFSYKKGHLDDGDYEISVGLVVDVFKPLLRDWIEMYIGELRSRMFIFKEDLIAAAWHPRRVERWYDYYGEGIFDKL